MVKFFLLVLFYFQLFVFTFQRKMTFICITIKKNNNNNNCYYYYLAVGQIEHMYLNIRSVSSVIDIHFHHSGQICNGAPFVRGIYKYVPCCRLIPVHKQFTYN